MRVQSHTLQHYDSIAEASGRMLEAARRSDWDGVVAEEKRCSELVAALQARADTTSASALSPEERAARHTIIRKVLADDAEIRNLAEPWMRHLESVLASSGNNRKLDDSYGSLA